MGLCKWKKIKQTDFHAVQKKYVGQHLDSEQIKSIFVQIGFNKSHYLVKTLEEFKIIVKNSDGSYSISNEGGITEPLLQQCGQAVSKRDNPKYRHPETWSEKKALQALLNAKNEDGTPKYEIRRRVPARWEIVTL